MNFFGRILDSDSPPKAEFWAFRMQKNDKFGQVFFSYVFSYCSLQIGSLRYEEKNRSPTEVIFFSRKGGGGRHFARRNFPPRSRKLQLSIVVMVSDLGTHPLEMSIVYLVSVKFLVGVSFQRSLCGPKLFCLKRFCSRSRLFLVLPCSDCRENLSKVRMSQFQTAFNCNFLVGEDERLRCGIW